ncbi:YqjD family protein [Aquabacterium sp.]|uniref:DUF883 family protein n=1 Tax=Aquabacterium sp. TaxID=1872578 RepID=UPI0035B2C0D3
MTDLTTIPKERLMADLKRVVADAEHLLQATAGQASADVADLRSKIQGTLAQAKANLADAQHVVVDKAKEVGRATDDFVHENPWKSIGVAAGVGLVIGLLIGRR